MNIKPATFAAITAINTGKSLAVDIAAEIGCSIRSVGGRLRSAIKSGFVVRSEGLRPGTYTLTQAGQALFPAPVAPVVVAEVVVKKATFPVIIADIPAGAVVTEIPSAIIAVAAPKGIAWVTKTGRAWLTGAVETALVAAGTKAQGVDPITFGAGSTPAALTAVYTEVLAADVLAAMSPRQVTWAVRQIRKGIKAATVAAE